MRIITRKVRVLIWAGLFYFGLIYAVALLPKEKLLGKHCLPAHLQDKLHDDYAGPAFLRLIPRSTTSWCIAEPPLMVAGNQKSFSINPKKQYGPKPVPQPGEWQLSLIRIKNSWPIFLPYLSLTTPNNLHFRIGCRWDDFDHYYTFPSFAIKKIASP